LGGRGVVLANVDDQYYAISDTCPHAGAPLGEGFLDESTLTCPLHGWTFDVITGECDIDPDEHLLCLDVQIRGDRVFVRVDADTVDLQQAPN
jgi:nitrite reductase (NADH) small subunit/3-phenylpropionate/trans-cinnamate dioxygenase ferredoxin subunit